MNKKGFTLVETITVLAIVGIFIAFFYTLYFLNWQACDQFIAYADFGQDMDQIIDQIGQDGRNATTIKITINSPTTQQVECLDTNGNPISTYTMTNTGVFTITNAQNNQNIITQKLDFANSAFVMDGNAIQVKLRLADQIFGHTVFLNSETEIYPRNLP